MFLQYDWVADGRLKHRQHQVGTFGRCSNTCLHSTDPPTGQVREDLLDSQEEEVEEALDCHDVERRVDHTRSNFALEAFVPQQEWILDE